MQVTTTITEWMTPQKGNFPLSHIVIMLLRLELTMSDERSMDSGFQLKYVMFFTKKSSNQIS